jgi:ABC-type uncharacterized transport system substrate-binding protein
MRRREALGVLGGAAVMWPRFVRAQQGQIPVIGFLNSASPKGYAPYSGAFVKGLQEVGYADGTSVRIEFRWAEGEYGRLPTMAAELVAARVSLIVANTPAHLAAKAATSTIPIVFTTSGDPVRIGLVASLNRPGGNVTGVTQLNVEVGPKRLSLAHEILPAATTIGLLVNPANPLTRTMEEQLRSAGAKLGVQLKVLQAGTDQEIDRCFGDFHQTASGVLVIGTDPFFNSRLERLGALTLQHRVPTVYQYNEFIEAGGLVSYGGSLVDSYRLAAGYAGRILKGDKPSELPVLQSTKIDFAINLKTAKALGISIPTSVLAGADNILE